MCVECHARNSSPSTKTPTPGFDIWQVIVFLHLPWFIFEFVRTVRFPLGSQHEGIGWAQVSEEPKRLTVAIVAAVGAALLAGASAWVLPRYLRKKADVPRWMQAIFLGAAAVVLVNAATRYLATPELAGAWWGQVLSAGYCALIAHYFRVDPKVKITFTR